MNKLRPIVLLSGLLFHSIVSFGQNKFLSPDKELNALNSDHQFAGSVLVAKAGKIVYHKNIGFADIEHKVPVNNNTTFEVASITKTFTAILILQLAEKGKIDLDASVSDYLPKFTPKDSGRITIHHLLSHTSGIQDFVGLNCDFASWNEKEFMEGLQKTPVHFKPGTQFEYASSTYILLRFIIEKITGRSYADILQENILTPAGMNHTGIIYNQAILNNRAMGYLNRDGHFQNAMPVASHEIFIGASSIYSTVEDLLIFDQALYSDKLLKQKEKELMYTVVKAPYGYGWFISDDTTNGKTVSHGGNVFGYTSLFERRLKNKTAVIILSNVQDVDRNKIVQILDKTLN